MDWYSDSGHGRGRGRSSFERIYYCYPFSSVGKEYLECGNKILMPMSALDSLVSLDISYPMIFEIKNTSANKASHCGVLEFTAEEGSIILPRWMMRNLLLQEGDHVTLTNVTLPRGLFMKLQPHTSNFLDISNPKETLEKALTNYSCLTTGDSIMITDNNNKNYFIDIIETKPSNAISIVDTNCEADFAPPLDYKEPEKPAPLPLDYKEPEKPAPLAQFNEAPVSESSNLSKVAGMGIPKRLDGQPSRLPVPLNAPRDPQRASCSNSGSASSRTRASQPSLVNQQVSHPSVGPSDSCWLDMLEDSKYPAIKFMGMGVPKRLDGQPSQLVSTQVQADDGLNA